MRRVTCEPYRGTALAITEPSVRRSVKRSTAAQRMTAPVHVCWKSLLRRNPMLNHWLRFLSRFAGVDPALKDVDLFLGPGAVAGHRPGAQSGEDVVRVRADVVIRPKVERELHRLSVARPEQRLDIVFEAERLHRRDFFRGGCRGSG